MQRMRDLIARAERSGVGLVVQYLCNEGAASIGGCARIEADDVIVDGFLAYERIPVASVIGVEALPSGRR
jgi:hypothetical protein